VFTESCNLDGIWGAGEEATSFIFLSLRKPAKGNEIFSSIVSAFYGAINLICGAFFAV
jgi:hypothetical protein